MLALCYVLLAFAVGYAVLHRCFPAFLSFGQAKTLGGEPLILRMPDWMIAVPAMYLVGSLLMTWVTYALCYLLRESGHASLYGAPLSVLIFAVLISPLLWKRRLQLLGFLRGLRQRRNWLPARAHRLEWVYILFALALACFIDFYTFYIYQDKLHMGVTVWSDFGPHVAVIRSFSLGENFPTTYPHFPADSIRYHFLFQFMVGVLETLGWRLDFAFNIPSILSLVSLFMLLYVLAVAITGQRWVGVLTGVLFFFRSSFAIFTFIKELIPSGNVWQGIWNVSLHIGKTENESWGLFAQNVYANQRHFAFSLALMMLIIYALLPLLRAMIERIRQGAACLPKQCACLGSEQVCVFRRFSSWRQVFVLDADAWWPASWQRAVFLGLLLGALGFWNGAVVIAALIVLGVLGIFSRHRLEFLIVAVLTITLSMVQSAFFIGGGSAVSPHFFFGFLAQYKTLIGVAAYYIELLGVFPILLIISLFGAPKGYKALALALIAPLIMATTISLTTDINANHKFVMIGVILANILVAALLYRLFTTAQREFKALATVLLALLVGTGVVDLLTLYNMNRNPIVMDLASPLAKWVEHNTQPHDVVLTSWSVLNPVQLAGRKIYYGWPYYAWSAGYDTDTRGKIVKQIFEAENADKLRQLLKQEKIAYILIDQDVRENKEYIINEPLLRQTFPLVFQDAEAKQFILRVN